jgi:hypothetical protein
VKPKAAAAYNEDDELVTSRIMATAKESQDTYQTINTAEGQVPWGRDTDLVATKASTGVPKKSEGCFFHGQSKRIWQWNSQVVDCPMLSCTLLMRVDVPGTR